MDNKVHGTDRVWKEVIDPSSRSVYYWNILTGETSWKSPNDDDDFLSTEERVSHDTKVIIDKIVHKVDPIKFFFDVINLISDVCDLEKAKDICSLKHDIENSLTSLNEILKIATPRTKTYDKFSELKKFLTEQKNYLKNNNCISDFLIEKINEARDEVARGFDSVKRFSVRNDDIIDDYNVYVEKRKHDQPLEQFVETKVETENVDLEKVDPDKDDNPKVPKRKPNPLKSLHDKWNRASEIIDQEDSADDLNKENIPSFVNTDENNPNLIPINKKWYENHN